MFQIQAIGPNGQSLTVPISENDMRTMIRDAVYVGVRASQEIEREPLGPYNPPPIETVPKSLLTTT